VRKALETYDIAIIGGGPGGEAAAQRARMRGAKTCLIEQNALGGTCLNVGCIPTKAMLCASDLFRHVQDARQFGIVVESAKLDGQAYMKRVHDVVSNIVKALDRKYATGEVDLIRGRGRLTAADTIQVDLNEGSQRQIRAASIIIATGSVAAKPAVFPWSSPNVWTTDQAVTAQQLPESVLIIGGGVIGCEFATVYSELGIPTTVVEMLDRLTEPLDADASKLIQRSLRRRKVNVLLRSKIVEMTADADGVKATTADGKIIEAAVALVAVGRKPNTDDIGLEAAGVQVDNGVISVDDRCRTNVDNIYAVGDVAERKQYAHLAARMGVVAAENATGHELADDRAIVPVGVFTHPEVASVGLTEAQAAAAHPQARSSSVEYRATGAAWAYNRTEGLVKIIADSARQQILGGLVVGYHAADVIQELATAMRNKLTVAQLAETIHTHPTFCEAVQLAAEKWLAES